MNRYFKAGDRVIYIDPGHVEHNRVFVHTGEINLVADYTGLYLLNNFNLWRIDDEYERTK
jgi:hypothetical protein